MPIDFVKPDLVELKPRISVIGVGGAGGNAVANMIEDGLEGVDFVVANTDAQALASSPAQTRIQLGLKVTQGLGAGARPEIGAAAAEEALDDIEAVLEDAHMCFITAGMGGGTGTGAAPVVARAARERGVLTVGVVTKPFAFEGLKRMRAAEAGIAELQQHVDTLIIIPNQNLFLIANQQTTFKQAFAMADQVLNQGVRGITDLMMFPGLINLDFADVRTVMSEMGKAMMGTGEAEGERRAIEAAEKAISNPLLDEVSLRGAKAVILNITGGDDLGLMEVEEAAQHIREMVDPDANIIVGSAFNSNLDGKMRVSVVATGIDSQAAASEGNVATTREQPRPAAVAAAPMASTIFPTATARPAAKATSPAEDPGKGPDDPNGGPGNGPSGGGPSGGPGGGGGTRVDAGDRGTAPGSMPPPSFTAPAEPATRPAAHLEEETAPAAELATDDHQMSDDDILELQNPIAEEPSVTELPLAAPQKRPAPQTPETADFEPEKKLTLFERMLAIGKPKVREEATEETGLSEDNLSDAPDTADDGTVIPPFFKAQRN